METKKTFRDLYKTLDTKTRNVIGFSDFDLFVAEVVKKYSLTEDQLSKLVRLTVHIIVGVEQKESFSVIISSILGTPTELSQEIANEITQKIINNIDALYAKTLLLEGEDLDEDEETFIKTELSLEIRRYRDKINDQELLNVLRGKPFIPAIEHVVTFLRQSPQLIQKLTLSTGWPNKVSEIGLKYSLTDIQIKIFISEVLLVIMQLENMDDLIERVEHELGVSAVLAEQLTEEVTARVLKVNEKNPLEKHQDTIVPREQSINSYIPENLPNLPGEVVENDKRPIKSVIGATPIVAQEKINLTIKDQVQDFFASKSVPAESSIEKPNILPERPDQVVAPALTPTPSFISNKLSQPTKTQDPQVDTPKNYSVDPYREPLE